MKDKLAGMIGLCRRSGNLACGSSAVEFALKGRKCFLVLLAGDCGESIKKKIINMCTTYKTEYIVVLNKEWLGNAAGLDGKAVVAVKSKDFAEGILKLI